MQLVSLVLLLGLAFASVGAVAPASWSMVDNRPNTTVIRPTGNYTLENRTFWGGVQVQIIGWGGGWIRIELRNLTVGGDLTVRVKDNTEVINIEVVVAQNRVEKNIRVEVENNQLNRNSGKNIEVRVHDNVAVQGIASKVLDNWVRLDLKYEMQRNHAGRTIEGEVDRNIVNNLLATVDANIGCERFRFQANDNTIDVALAASVTGNNATLYTSIFIMRNDRPAPYPQLFTSMHVNLEDNHAVRADLTIDVSRNKMAIIGSPFMDITVADNGAGRDVIMVFVSNEAVPGMIRMDIHDNASDGSTTIYINSNVAAVLSIIVIDNYARTSPPRVGPQFSVALRNLVRDAQATGGDGDADGLSDTYESMVGLDPGKNDTDGDGLYDGWVDNGDRRWSAGEDYGELGDPRQVAGSSAGQNVCRGGAATLFSNQKHEPNPLCRDLYVEVDRMAGTSWPNAVIGRVGTAFERHMIWLHVDDGWPVGLAGPAGGRGGGEVLPRTDPLWFFREPGANNDFYDLKSAHFNSNRRGVFHYAIVGHRVQFRGAGGAIVNTSTGIAAGANFVLDGDDFFLADATIRNMARDLRRSPNVGLAGVFMHELGHTLGLGPPPFRPTSFAGIDNATSDPLSPTFNRRAWGTYRSVMNYRYTMSGLLDYSDGMNGRDLLGNPDFDDWSRIDLTRIRQWGVYEG